MPHPTSSAASRRRALKSSRLSSIEALESRIAPAFTGSYSGSGNSGTLTLDGTAGDDVASFILTSLTTLTITNITPVGGPQSFDLTNVTSIVVHGLTGNDSITLNLTGGAIATAAHPFTFDGGGDAGDLLTFHG